MKSILLSLLLSPLLFFASAQRPAPDNFETGMGTLSIQPIQHASLILTVKGITIDADPSNPDNYKGLTPPNIILITDIHGDHFDVKTIEAVKKPGTVLVVPQVCADKLPEADKTNMVVLKNGDDTKQSGINIHATSHVQSA